MECIRYKNVKGGLPKCAFVRIAEQEGFRRVWCNGDMYVRVFTTSLGHKFPPQNDHVNDGTTPAGSAMAVHFLNMISDESDEDDADVLNKYTCDVPRLLFVSSAPACRLPACLTACLLACLPAWLYVVTS